MKKPTDEIRKAPVAADALDVSPLERSAVSFDVYRSDSLGASKGTRLRLIHDGTLAARVLQQAIDEVRGRPEKLPFAAFRCARHVRCGRLPYRQVWSGLYRAASDAGAAEPWILRCLYRAFALVNVSDAPTAELAELAGEAAS
jgi:hypothetical protein